MPLLSKLTLVTTLEATMNSIPLLLTDKTPSLAGTTSKPSGLGKKTRKELGNQVKTCKEDKKLLRFSTITWMQHLKDKNTIS